MLFVIDRDTLQVIKAATDKSAVGVVEGKRGDDTPFEVVFVRNGVAEELEESTVLTFGAKQAGKYDAAAVVLNSDFTLSGTGTTAKYLASPSFNTAELNALFLIDENDANDPPYIDLMAEFTWQVGVGAPTSTRTFTIRVHNDVVRDEELSPTPIPTPIGTTAPTNFEATLVKFVIDAYDSGDLSETPSGSFSTDGTDTIAEFGVWNLIENHSAGWTIKIFEDFSLLYFYDSIDDAASPELAEWPTTPSVVTVTKEAGASATLAPPYIRVAGGFLYIQEAGVWKKVALSAL